MSLRKRFKNDEHEVDMGPLNDILFILMFFFLIISTLANPNVIKLTNPKSKTETKAKQSLVVSIKKDGSTYIGQQQVKFDSLTSELTRRINKMDTAKNWIHSVTGKEKSSEPGHTDPSTGSGSILDQAHEHM